MSKKSGNYDQNRFKVAGTTQPGDDISPEREKAKVAKSDAKVEQKERDHNKLKGE